MFFYSQAPRVCAEVEDPTLNLALKFGFKKEFRRDDFPE